MSEKGRKMLVNFILAFLTASAIGLYTAAELPRVLIGGATAVILAFLGGVLPCAAACAIGLVAGVLLCGGDIFLMNGGIVIAAIALPMGIMLKRRSPFKRIMGVSCGVSAFVSLLLGGDRKSVV